MIPEGNYAAKAVEFAYGTAGTGMKQIGVSFELTEGEFAGSRLSWFGFFNSAENKTRTFESLESAGADLKDPVNLPGLGSKDVQVVIKHEEYQGKMRARIAFVNSGGGVAMKDRMTAEEVKAFTASMKGDLLAFTQKRATGGASTAKSQPKTSAPKPAPSGGQPSDDFFGD